ncbi:MAG TPA: right-handed parallel beta-helix repeat-containing protein [Gemmatimonadales bacterium]|nr:right-handed parallel beta-helix repeat-containing protein [Gemmatimonadales bacterium]
MRIPPPGRLLAGVIPAICSSACGSDKAAGPGPVPTHVGYYALPTGSAAGDGSVGRPWDLATALAGAGRVHPGDTIWLRGGVYRGYFRTKLNGTAGARIIVRQYPGERATIDGTLRAEGSYLTFWGFEIMQSNPDSVNSYVLQAYTTDGRFTNLVLHDAGISGVSMSTTSGAGVELYGCIIYNNGTHENLDHGIYAHNTTAALKHIVDNVLFNNYARGIQIYEGDSSVMRNFDVDGNVSFNNGSISDSSTRVNLLISAPTTTSGIVAERNLLYLSSSTGGVNIRVGNYGSVYNKDIVLRNNYAAGGSIALQMEHEWDRATVENNVFLGSSVTDEVRTGGVNVGAAYRWAGNAYYRNPSALAWKHDSTDYTFEGWKGVTGLGASDLATAVLPTTPQVVVRPNRYEPGRAHIVVYNWGQGASAAVDVSGVVRVGAPYEVRNVQDIFGTPIATGTYAGGLIAIPMTGVQPPVPIGRVAPQVAPRTAPDFDVFLITSTR